MTKIELSYSNFNNNGNEIVEIVANHLRLNQDDDEVWQFMLIDFKHLKKVEKMILEDALLIYVDLDLLGASLQRLESEFELVEDQRFLPLPLNCQGAILVFRKGDVL